MITITVIIVILVVIVILSIVRITTVIVLIVVIIMIIMIHAGWAVCSAVRAPSCWQLLLPLDRRPRTSGRGSHAQSRYENSGLRRV